MTQVDFHTGVADKLGFACRLIRKAWRAGSDLVVTGAPADLARLDAQLWLFDPNDFIPHARLRAGSAPPPRLARTPIWLADDPADAGARAVLVNLGPGMVADAGAWPRVIEIVAQSDDEVAGGRLRWREHQRAGREPVNHPQPTGSS